MALKQLNVTERRLDKNPEVKKVALSYGRVFQWKVCREDRRVTDQRRLALPHNPVISETKPTKVRIVFDSEPKLRVYFE